MKCYCVSHFRSPLEAQTRATPVPTGTQVLLRVKAAGVCHSDIHIWEGGYDLGQGRTLALKDRGVSLPLTMGHETVGTLVAAGPDATGLEMDRNYLVYPWIGCGQCEACTQGKENYCANPACLGIHRSGGYADHILVPHPRYLIDIGALDPALIAPYACSGLTTYSALKKIGKDVYTRHPMLIFGAGGLGLMCLALLKALGSPGAIVVDLDPIKRQAALEAGALAAIDGNAADLAQQILNANHGNPVHAAIDLVGAPSTGSAAFNALAKAGMLVMVGLFGGQSAWPMALIPIKAVTIIGSYVGNLDELRELMQLVLNKKVSPIPVNRYPLEQANDVLSALIAGKIVGRAVLTN